MLEYILKRLLRSLLTLFIIVTVVFSLLRLMPVEGYFHDYDKLSSAQIRVGLENLGLNKPLPVQLVNFYKQLLRGDLGVSNKYRVNYPIVKIIGPKLALSLRMGLTAVGIALIAGLPLGALMARSSRSRLRVFDRFGMAFVVLVQAVPQAIYHLYIQIYGTGGIGLPTLFREDRPVTWILPVISLCLYNLTYYAIWLRRFMVDEGNKDYIRLAQAKGLASGTISRGHVLRNAIVPLAQMVPGSVLITLMGSLYVESLYSIPGMGGLLVDVIKRQDNTMVQALVLIYAAISILGMLLGDVIMAALDPRIALKAGNGAR